MGPDNSNNGSSSLMKIEREDKQMLEGLNSLIQLQQTRLEGEQSLRDAATANQGNQQQTQSQTTSNAKLAQEKLNAQYAVEAQRIFKK